MKSALHQENVSPSELQNNIAEFLLSLPNIAKTAAREAFILRMGIEDKLRHQIKIEGSSGEFVCKLILILKEYGTLEDGRNALEAALQTAKTYVGKNRQVDCDRLIQGLHTFSNSQKTGRFSPSDKAMVSPQKSRHNKWFDPFFRKRYYEKAIRHSRHIRTFNVAGLFTKGAYILEIEQVFVELRMAPCHLQKANVNPIAFNNLSGSHPVWEFLQRLEQQNGVALAIIGAPGCGKTTLLQYIALALTKHKRQYGLKVVTPIFLLLREHVQTILEDCPSLAELVQMHFSDAKRYPNLNPPFQYFENELDKGRCLILLDGLDEVSELEQRKLISQWIDTQIQNYSRNRFVVTARPRGYQDAPLQSAHVLEVMAFNPKQVERFGSGSNPLISILDK